MRWKGFITLFILLLMGVAVSMLSVDGWIESGLERMGEGIVGARVEIDDLDFRPLDLSIQWDRLQIADPKNTMRNIVETGRAAFDLRSAALLKKRFIIEEMTLNDVRSGSPRSKDGALPPKRIREKKEEKPGILDKVKDGLIREIETLPVMRFDAIALRRKVNVDSLMAMVDLKIVDRIDSVRQDVIRTVKKWEAFYEGFHPEDDFEKIRADIASVDIKNVKTVPELISVYEKVQSAQKILNGLSETVEGKYGEIHSNIEQIDSYRKNVGGWIDEDYRRILEKARLPDLSARWMGKILFGPTLVHRLNTYLDYLRIVRKIVPKKSDKPKKEKPQRMKGQTIRFADRHGWPGFLIEKASFSGRSEERGVWVSGETRGITSQPRIYGKPTTIDLGWSMEGRQSAVFHAMLDHTTEAAKDLFRLKIENIPLKTVEILESPYLPSRIQGGQADFTSEIRLEDGGLILTTDVQARGLRFDFDGTGTGNVFAGIVRDVLKDVNILTFRAEVSFRGDDFVFSMISNLDDLISAELKRLASRALMEAQKQIQARLNDFSSGKIAELNRLFDGMKENIGGPIDAYRRRVEELNVGIEGKIKEITDDIQRLQKSELEDKTKKLLENLLKKK